MKALKEIVRPNIYRLKPYSCARNEFKGEASAWLDANENAFNSPYNRYPDPLQLEVKRMLGELRGVAPGQIFLGVGSDECIDMVYRVFCRPGIDNVVAIAPTYGMYEVCADINDVEYRRAPLRSDFSLDADALLSRTDANTKAIWLCSPNNPTGNAFPLEQIEQVVAGFDGIVVVDEAYIDFSDKGSALQLLPKYGNLIVMQTFSKAWGSAGVRLGVAYAAKEIIDIFNNVKYPYNISILTQKYAIGLLSDHGKVREWVSALLSSRDRLIGQLSEFDFVEKIYPTDANFVLVKVADANRINNYLCRKKIVVRNRSNVEMCMNCLRITSGTDEENGLLIQALADYGRTEK